MDRLREEEAEDEKEEEESTVRWMNWRVNVRDILEKAAGDTQHLKSLLVEI